jgi:predicted glycosyltransferase
MTDRLSGARILIYSHDTFGLGHLRRCRAIAHSMVERFKGLSVLILSGSPIIGSFDYRARVDFVRIPGVIKLYNGEYTSLGLHIELEQTMAMRSAIIRQTAETFAPNLFLVDKEPLGLKSEVRDTLTMLKARGTKLALGLRDVMDDPDMLAAEWERKEVLPALENLYDEIWVYGLEQICNPLAGIDVSAAVSRKMIYTGYLPRSLPQATTIRPAIEMSEPYVLVTAGGGGDGEDMIDWVLDAYTLEPDLPYGALLVLGPFMQPALQRRLQDRVARLDRVKVITFDTHMEILMDEAVGVVAMGGYNTFCEILSLDKRALIVPRSKPRREQLIRATRASELGLVRMLDGDGDRDPAVMARALRDMPLQSKPSQVVVPGLLDGLTSINRLVERGFAEVPRPTLTVAQNP